MTPVGAGRGYAIGAKSRVKCSLRALKMAQLLTALSANMHKTGSGDNNIRIVDRL